MEETKGNYLDLYDYAPVGYMTLSDKGMILEANLTAAQMLGLERKSLINRLLHAFLTKEDQDTLCLHLNSVLVNQGKLTCQVSPLKKNGDPYHAHVESTAALDIEGKFNVIRTVVVDITERKKAEDALKKKMNELERFNSTMVGRELRMIELKKEINELLKKADEPEKCRIGE